MKFISLRGLTDADGELQETLHWLASAEACEYINAVELLNLQNQASLVGRQLGSMINRHETFCF